MLTINSYFKNYPSLSVELDWHERYWAHLPPKTRVDTPPETLLEHCQLVCDYFKNLCEVHRLEAVIDALIEESLLLNKNLSHSEKIKDFVKTFFLNVVSFHDYGKVNENYQVLRMKNIASFQENKNLTIVPNYGHSFLGAYIFITYHLEKLIELETDTDTEATLTVFIYALSYPILCHHKPAIFDAEDSLKKSTLNKWFKELRGYLTLYQIRFDEEMSDYFLRDEFENQWNDFWGNSQNSFPLFALIKLSFSLLTASDYLATHEYMNDAETKDFGVLERKRIVEFTQFLRNNGHNKVAYDALEGYQFKFPTEKSNDNLNQLRQEMAVELIQTIRQNLQKRLFYIEAPTGGGKTNLSMITVTEILMANPELNKVFYVFPFTTLITQTYKALKETLGLREDELVELHSKAGFHSKISKEEQKDGEYGDDKKDFIDNLFALYPVTVLSHVKFFDILKTNDKETNYLLHRLANSVVIIDEVQSYNPKIWDKMLYFINEYARYFNIRFVLMSATLPKISSLEIGLSQKPDFVDLLPNARKYITNPNFAERIRFNFEIFEETMSLERLAEIIILKSNDYAASHGSVRTIVEFIYKKSASEFQQLFQSLEHPFDEILVLSGTILEPRRREIINAIKRTSDKNILLITTQVVEAGVDIDMDLGFKNVSLLDSDEQLAGRVNRNASKEECEVYLFQLDDASVLYKGDHRFQETKDMGLPEREKILNQKDFKFLYEKVFSRIDKLNNLNLADNFTKGYEPDLKKLRFAEVDKNFKIIDQQNESVFVPLALPVEIEGSKDGEVEVLFSGKELTFLKSFGVEPNWKRELDGEDVWGVYKKLIFREIDRRKNKEGFNLTSKNQLKTLQGIMSKFTFSLFAHAKVLKDLESQGFLIEKYGYKLISEQALSTPVPVYTLEQGLNENALNTTENYFL
jgi:CRISPR-associated endonuclease/helicase Cas3